MSFAPAPASGLCSVRGDVRGQLARWGRSELAEDAVLVVSELLGNAFGHGAGPVRLSLALHERAGHQWLMIQVSDTSPGFDIEVIRARWTRPSAALSGGGHGLLLVGALSRAWGDRHHRRGIRSGPICRGVSPEGARARGAEGLWGTSGAGELRGERRWPRAVAGRGVVPGPGRPARSPGACGLGRSVAERFLGGSSGAPQAGKGVRVSGVVVGCFEPPAGSTVMPMPEAPSTAPRRRTAWSLRVGFIRPADRMVPPSSNQSW